MNDPVPTLDEARALAGAGDDERAKHAYIALLRHQPTHRDALVELGALAHASNHLAAARTAYGHAVRFHPADPVALTGLANLLADIEPQAARAHYRAALAARPAYPPAHQGLARLLADAGEHGDAELHWRRGFDGHALHRRRHLGPGPGVPLLLLVAARGGNIPTRHWIDERHFAVTALYVDFFDPHAPIPPHDLLVNAIGDADLVPDALAAAEHIAGRSLAPIVNAPALVRRTGRATTGLHLRSLPGLRVPRIRTLRRDEVAEHAEHFPLLLRAPGFHTGRHFLRIDRRADLPPAVAALPGDELLLIEYLNARGPDALARKYRVMFIAGGLYPIHLAVSPDWKVHYVTSAMADVTAHRAEEQAFLDDPATCLGASAMAALRSVAATIGLDYAGIDFALSPDGQILLFEANATMVINPPEPDPIWNYRRPAIEAALQAARGLLLERAAGRPSSLPASTA